MSPTLLGALIALGMSAVILGLLFWLWPRSGKMGINTQTVNCPQCGLKAPKVRKPTSLRQAMWGGWTCADCGCEFDKYGKKIEAG